MRFRSLWFLACLVCSVFPLGQSHAQQGFSAFDVGNAAQEAQPGVRPGRWLWSVSDMPPLRNGATAVAVAQDAPSTVYIGGFESVVVSQDGGRTFKPSLRFNADAENDPIVSFSTNDSERSQQRAEALREYLRVNLEEQFDSGYVESLLDEITDEDLLDANEVTDLEPLQNMELDMDSDLRNVQLDIPAAYHVTNLSNYDSFIQRFKLARGAGIDSNAGENIAYAAHSPAVWQIRAIGTTAYAVTSSMIYVTRDSGNSWQAMLQAAEGESFLSIDATPGLDKIVIGATNGLIVSQDGGGTWMRTGHNVRGAVYEVRYGASDAIWALTTRGVFTTANLGVNAGRSAEMALDDEFEESKDAEQAQSSGVLQLEWSRFDLPVPATETLLHIYQGVAGNVLLLTSGGLYATHDLVNWIPIGAEVLNDAYVRDIYVRDSSLASFVVITDSQILEYDNGWFNQSKGIGALRNVHVAPLSGGTRLAVAVTEAAVYFAYDSKDIEHDEAYADLLEQWKHEPSYHDTIQAALADRYESLDGNWRLRSRLAWILPRVTGEYMYRQYRRDIETEYQTASTWAQTRQYNYRREENMEWAVYAFWDLRIEQAFKNDHYVDRLEPTYEEQKELVDRVVEALDQRRSLQIGKIIQRLESGDLSLEDEINYELAMQEVEATLHYLTGGFYIPAVKNWK